MSKKVKKYSIDHYYSILTRLRKALGDDLIYSMAMDTDQDGKPLFIVAVSVHKSKTQMFNHDRPQQNAVLSNADLEDDATNVANALIQMFKQILIPRIENNLNDKYRIESIVLRDKDGNILQ